jgi:hypothetical protein
MHWNFAGKVVMAKCHDAQVALRFCGGLARELG